MVGRCWKWVLVPLVVLMGGQVGVRSPQELAGALASADGGVVSGAMGEIRGRLGEQPGLAYQIRGVWLKPLMENHRYGEALSLCEEGICAVPQDLGMVEFLQRERVEILGLMGRKEEALGAAKGLFNVCSTGQTESALLLLAERLNDVSGNGSGAVEKLVEEERRGMAPSQTAVVSDVVRVIRVDASPFEAGIKGLYAPSGELPLWGPQLMGLGNLLLVADRPGEALKVFEKYKSGAGARELRGANEGVARAMRAEDGTVGRGNGYILGLKR
ncbi:MAG: hypothetical protein ACTHN5_07545 [Phycisphaerae bacterium]